MDEGSGVGVLDKAAAVLTALETSPLTLAGLVGATGLARPTAHHRPWPWNTIASLPGTSRAVSYSDRGSRN